MSNSVHVDGLNSEQREAVHYLDGPCLVLAGAGSGKTRVITQKIAYLLNHCGYQANQIIALTFTNKAAKEMLERLKPLVDKSLLKGLTICTFHALGVRFLRQEAEMIGLKQQFSILDALDAGNILQELLATTDKGRIKSVQQIISLWKNQLILPEQAAKQAQTPEEHEIARVYLSYQETLKAYQAVDFDDLILLPVLHLKNDEELRKRWQTRVKYLLVDEYQDTNVSQYEWIKLLTGGSQKFTAVGDDDQAIYAWRGATVENLQQLTFDFKDLKLIKLEQNYRSVGTILTAANRVISHNPNVFEKSLWSDLGKGQPIQVSIMDHEVEEAEKVAMRISSMRFEQKADWKDFAVLYRSNHQARILEQIFREMRIPYLLSGGQSFFEKTEVRDILAYLRLLVNEDDDAAFIRAVTTPKRGVGQQSLKQLGEYATLHQMSLNTAATQDILVETISPRAWRNLQEFVQIMNRFRWQASRGRIGLKNLELFHPELKNATDLLDDLMGFIQYERYLYEMYDERAALKRWQNVQELISWLKQKAIDEEKDLEQLIQHIALITMLERNEQEDQPDAVKFTTIHASKGLEYPYVHLIGTEEGLLPHLGNDDEYGDPSKENEGFIERIQEERRLMYVAITRAKQHLTISWCKKRRKARENLVREPSRFISEMGLDSGLIEQQDPFQGMTPQQRIQRLKSLLNNKVD